MNYEEFLDRYLKIVPAHSFGLEEKELLPNEELKNFSDIDKTCNCRPGFVKDE